MRSHWKMKEHMHTVGITCYVSVSWISTRTFDRKIHMLAFSDVQFGWRVRCHVDTPLTHSNGLCWKGLCTVRISRNISLLTKPRTFIRLTLSIHPKWISHVGEVIFKKILKFCVSHYVMYTLWKAPHSHIVYTFIAYEWVDFKTCTCVLCFSVWDYVRFGKHLTHVFLCWPWHRTLHQDVWSDDGTDSLCQRWVCRQIASTCGW